MLCKPSFSFFFRNNAPSRRSLGKVKPLRQKWQLVETKQHFQFWCLMTVLRMFTTSTDKSYHLKIEKCSCGKHNKIRFTGLAVANDVGNKLPMLVTGKDVNKTFQAKERKVALIIDNCPAHSIIENLSHVKLVFLPANTTSVRQPLDQGVIRCLKAHYRKRLEMLILSSLDFDKSLPKVSLLTALQLLVSA